MVIIKNDFCSLNNCSLQTNNTTEFKSSDNPSGFLKPGVDTPTALKDYYIDDVYFFTYIIKNNHNGTFTNVTSTSNTGRLVPYVPGEDFATLVFNAGINQITSLTEDGYFSIYSIGIPKESIKNITRAISSNHNYYVKSDLKVYTVNNGIETVVDIYTLLTTTFNLTNSNVLITKIDVISQCYLLKCLDFILAEFATKYTDPTCIKNNNEFTELCRKRDMIFSITNTVTYYVELLQYYKASKLIYDASFCSVCKEYVTTTTNNCNCHA